MLFVSTILVVFLAAIIVAVLVKRRSSSSPLSKNQLINIPAKNFRPLFAPDEESMRAYKREQGAQNEKKKHIESNRIAAERRRQFAVQREIWQAAPNKSNTLELVRCAAENDDWEIYQTTAEQIIAQKLSGNLGELTKHQLAQLLESHFWLLSAESRTSGATFWLKTTVADLRRKSNITN